ncbi:competence protein ComEA [Oceanobacillus limi]|uniref:Competence protein ComEA n=1 Tax=Oceanobacillus limi TaxID=930131 RepID=A0A1I0FW87_9BACI|nr:helix-hairpin-helix domain-containing protein [Oceanobacillus limi]SET61929.1 competence protein ComEA [Oceanobacillus limi]
MLHLLKKPHFIIVGIAILAVIIVVSIQPFSSVDNSAIPPIAPEKALEQMESPTKIQSNEIVVDIKGEIQQPGVYEMAVDSRVEDVVQTAGGFTEKADQTVINLAQKVHDEMVIIVPSEQDLEGNEMTKSVDRDASKIRINYATSEEIEHLNGIGPSKAEAIIQYREESGLFQSVEDLLNVPGIGEKTLDKIRETIVVP